MLMFGLFFVLYFVKLSVGNGFWSNDDLLHNTLKDSLTNIATDIISQDELEELAVTLCDKLMKAVDTSTPKVYSRNDPKSPIG